MNDITYSILLFTTFAGIMASIGHALRARRIENEAQKAEFAHVAHINSLSRHLQASRTILRAEEATNPHTEWLDSYLRAQLNMSHPSEILNTDEISKARESLHRYIDKHRTNARGEESPDLLLADYRECKKELRRLQKSNLQPPDACTAVKASHTFQNAVAAWGRAHDVSVEWVTWSPEGPGRVLWKATAPPHNRGASPFAHLNEFFSGGFKL